MRPYVDRRIDDLDAATRAADLAATRWSLDRPMLIRHGMNAIFRCGDVVLRVATPSVPAVLSIELAHVLVDRGIPVPRPVRGDVVTSGNLSVTAWEFVESSDEPVDWRAVGAIVRDVHRCGVDDLPRGLPRPTPADLPWWDFESLFDRVSDDLDAAARHGLRAAIDRWPGWASTDDVPVVVCHGDVHPGNVIMTGEGPVLLDWDLLSVAPAAWDHAPLMTWTDRWGGEPGVYEAFVEGYGCSARGDRSGEGFAELRLVAATIMRVIAALGDRSARPEADRRLAFWRGDPDAPSWSAQ